MSPVRRARATAVAAIRHDDTHAARTAHTLSTTDTAIAHGIDIPPPPPLLPPLLSWARTPAIQRAPSVTSNKNTSRRLDHEIREAGVIPEKGPRPVHPRHGGLCCCTGSDGTGLNGENENRLTRFLPFALVHEANAKQEEEFLGKKVKKREKK
ncbi:hypothetical protein ABZP36_018023 [Zizania latifolia]